MAQEVSSVEFIQEVQRRSWEWENAQNSIQYYLGKSKNDPERGKLDYLRIARSQLDFWQKAEKHLNKN